MQLCKHVPPELFSRVTEKVNPFSRFIQARLLQKLNIFEALNKLCGIQHARPVGLNEKCIYVLLGWIGQHNAYFPMAYSRTGSDMAPFLVYA